MTDPDDIIAVSNISLLDDNCKCETCSASGEASCGNSGGGTTGNDCVSLRMDMGHDPRGVSYGALRICEETPSPDIYSPKSLQYISQPIAGFVSRNPNPDGPITAIGLPHVKVFVTVTGSTASGPTGFEVSFHPLAIPDGSGTGTWRTNPAVVWAVQNPDPSGNTCDRVNIIERRSGGERVSRYQYLSGDQSGWVLTTGSGINTRVESRLTSISGGVRTVVTAVKDGSGALVWQKTEVYQVIGNGTTDCLVSSTEGAGQDAKTTSYTYYDDATQSNFERIKQKIDPTGHWERYTYDDSGRVTKTVSQYLNNGSFSVLRRILAGTGRRKGMFSEKAGSGSLRRVLKIECKTTFKTCIGAKATGWPV